MNQYSVKTELVEDWLTDKVDAKARKTRKVILDILEVFEEVGPVVKDKLPQSKIAPLFDGIWEIRVGQYRIAYFWDGATCVLLHGIQKKRDEWSHKDRKLIKQRKKRYFH